MKIKMYLIYLFILGIFLSACNQGLKYPDKLPEAANIQTSTYNGIATKTYSDKDGNVFRVAHFNDKNELCLDSFYGSAEVITLIKGKITETVYYDATKRPMINTNLGYACSRYAYNKDRYMLEEAYYGLDDKLIIPSQSYQDYAMRRYEYDSGNMTTKMTSYDAKEKVILPIVTYSYDSSYNNNKISYVNEKGELMLNKQGYAYVEYKYTGESLDEYSYHDTKGNLVMVDESESGDGDDLSSIPHARGVWSYVSQGDTTSIVKLYDADNKLIKEFAYNDNEGGEGDGGYYLEVNDNTFSDGKKMNSLLTFACKALLQFKPGANAFKILQNWSLFSHTRTDDFSSALRLWYDPTLWEKNENGGKRTKDEAESKNDSMAWDMYYVTDYFIQHPAKVKDAFEKVKPLVKQFVPKNLYTKCGASLLVSTAMSAYDDIQKKGAPAMLQNINKVMKISETPDFYQLADLYKPMKEYIGMSTSDVNSTDLSEEEKKEVIVWAYSFWLRRSNESSTDVALQLLKGINELYQ